MILVKSLFPKNNNLYVSPLFLAKVRGKEKPLMPLAIVGVGRTCWLALGMFLSLTTLKQQLQPTKFPKPWLLWCFQHEKHRQIGRSHMLHGNNAEKTIHSFTLFHSQPQIASIPKKAQNQRLNCVSTHQERSTLTVDLQIAPTRSLWSVPIDRSIIGRSLTPQTSPEARPLGLLTSSHTLRGIWEEDLDD